MYIGNKYNFITIINSFFLNCMYMYLTCTYTISNHVHVYTVGRLFFEGYKFREFRDFLKIRENYFCENQNNTVQDGRRHKFAKIKSAK